jgi:hypothetical protein
MTQQTAIKQQFVNTKLDEALSRAGLPVDYPIRGLLDRDLEIADTGREPWVYVSRPDRDITLDERLAELINDATPKHNFPKDLPTVDKRDLGQLREHFSEIASGKTTVK